MDMGWLVPTVFWAAVVLIVALNVRARMAAERERQQTLRTLIERGQALDADLVRQMLAGSTEHKSPFALVVAGIVVASFGLGLALLGVFLALEVPGPWIAPALLALAFARGEDPNRPFGGVPFRVWAGCVS